MGGKLKEKLRNLWKWSTKASVFTNNNNLTKLCLGLLTIFDQIACFRVYSGS